MAIKKTAKKTAKKVVKKVAKKATKKTSKKISSSDIKEARKRVSAIIEAIRKVELRTREDLVWVAHTGQEMPKELKRKKVCIFTKNGLKSPPRKASEWDWTVDENLGSIVAYAVVK